ncbi:MAG: GIY-YIG nuclease family protein [Mesorhizobium sp.]|nr:MAG: GIY-YIG nuclease family protein [Mesorhizobium sp.]
MNRNARYSLFPRRALGAVHFMRAAMGRSASRQQERRLHLPRTGSVTTPVSSLRLPSAAGDFLIYECLGLGRSRMFVYCAVNKSLPGLVKIGMTRDHPDNRMEQLSSTSVPTPFTCVWSVRTLNPARDEKRLHKVLNSHRHSVNREFFRCSPEFAQSAAMSIGLNFNDTGPRFESSHTLGYENSEWIGALAFFIAFLVTMPVWSADIHWYYKPLINFLLPMVLGLGLQLYLMTKSSG